MSKSFTLRLPEEISNWIDDGSVASGVSKAQFVVNALSKIKEAQEDSAVLHLQDNRLTPVLQTQDNSLTPVRQIQDNMLTPVRQTQDNLQDSILQLTKAVKAATAQLEQLTPQKTKPVQKTKATKSSEKPNSKPKGKNKGKGKTTPKGGAPAPLYEYKGIEGTLREHIITALGQINDKDIRLTTRMINKRIKGGEPSNKAIKDAIAHRKAALKS